MASRPSSERLHRHRIDDDRKPAAQQLLAKCACRIAASRRTIFQRLVGESSRHGLSNGPCDDQFSSASAEFRPNRSAHCGAFGLRRLLRALKSTTPGAATSNQRARARWLLVAAPGVVLFNALSNRLSPNAPQWADRFGLNSALAELNWSSHGPFESPWRLDSPTSR